jgi:tetratricopeptide (TPR) repeat protein
MTPVGPDPECVVQVRARPSFGTGYLIAPGLLLTAAHVVMTEPPAAVTVRVPGREPVDGEVVWSQRDERIDAALVRVTPAHGTATGSAITRFGMFLSAEPNQQIEAIGFPRQQKFESVRDQEQFAGLLNPMTGAVSGHYELTSVTPLPGAAPGDARTPWAGMSGAAVFSRGLLVGVLRSDRRAQFGARLTATPVSTLLADGTFRGIVRESTGWEPVCEPVELAGVLDSPYPNRDIRSVTSLLRADAEAVRFHGREPVIERLASWCAGPEQVAVMIVTGQGGEGKSRLARQFLAWQRAGGWITGLLRPTSADDMTAEERFAPIARSRGPLLLAVDYAENHPRQVRALVRHAKAARVPVRVLLVARDRGMWADALDEPDADVRDLLVDAPELALPPLTSTADDWDTTFGHAVRDIAQALRTLPGHEEPDWLAVAGRTAPPSAETHHRPSSVLGIEMTALTMLLQQVFPLAAERGEPVERILLRHEEAYWTRTAQRCGLRGLDRTTLRCAVAALRLVTVADRDQAIRLLTALGVSDTDRGRIAARWLRELYPREDGHLAFVQPDRLAEFLLVEACAEEHELLPNIVSAARDCGDPRQLAVIESEFDAESAAMFGQMTALREAVRVARSQVYFGNEVRPLLEQIERTASRPVISDETLAWTITNVQTLPAAGQRQDVREHADGSRTITSVLDAASAALEVAGYRRGAHPFVHGDVRQQGFAASMHSLSLSQLGRYEEALEVGAQAVERFRSVPGGTEQLVHQIHQQGELHLKLGQHAKAAEAMCEEADLLRPAEAAPARDQAQSYVQALGRAAETLDTTGKFAEALERCVRAEQFLTGLPAGELAGDRALLAGVRAHILANMGDDAGSIAAWLDSAARWQRIDGPYQDQDPAAREVMSLNNAAVGYEKLGRHDLAVGVLSHAVELALSERGESVRRDRPELYEQVHATYVGYLIGVGDAERALREAERLWEHPVASSTPLPLSFANSLREVSLALAGAGRVAEATRASRMAVATLQATELSPEHLPLLATTLADHTANLAETGAGSEGAVAGAQATEAWRRVCAMDARWRINLVTALANQAECLRLDARPGEAAQVFAEAAGILREVTQGSSQERSMLTNLLRGQASCHFQTGNHEAAARVRTEQIELLRDWGETDPSAGAALATAYTELAISNEKLGHLPGALAAAEQAVGILHHLYGPEPGPRWQEVARALLVYGKILVLLDQPVVAVAPLVKAMAIAVRAGDLDFAASCRAGVDFAGFVDPAGVAAEWRRLTGTDYPGPTRPR